jgi:hypothetical protein
MTVVASSEYGDPPRWLRWDRVIHTVTDYQIASEQCEQIGRLLASLQIRLKAGLLASSME